MIRYSRALEKKKESSQIGLFDMSESTYKESLQLEQAKPFTYEQKLFGEKDVMGFMVSGHPLDSLQTYCGRRSTNVRYLKMSMEELTAMQQADEEKFKKDI
jgi:DNA polymerase III alpha subunit